MQSPASDDRWRAHGAAAALGLIWYLWHGGAPTLDPTNVGWVVSEDLSQHFLGWLFFRQAPWGLPLGALPNLGAPIGTSIGFMDANPLLCVLFKSISDWLPMYFQFQGWWLASCYALLGLTASMLASLIKPSALGRLAIIFVCVSSPTALQRVCHENLAAHWIILLALWLVLKPSPDAAESRRSAKGAIALTALAMTVHAYLMGCVLPLNLWAIGRRVWVDKTLRSKAAIGYAAALLACLAAVLLLFGFVGGGVNLGDPGFGDQSADLLSLVNPRGWSRMLPSVQPELPFESFGYVGAGGILLLTMGLFCALRPKRVAASALSLHLRTASWIIGAEGLFALSDQIKLAGHVLLDLRPLTESFLPVFSVYRASGRFLWPVIYYLFIAAAAALVRRLPARRAALAFVGVLLLQLVDYSAPEREVHERLTRHEVLQLKSPIWQKLAEGYTDMVLYPPFYPGARASCDGDIEYAWGYQVPFTFKAYENHLTFNCVYAGRDNGPNAKAYCEKLHADVAARIFAPQTVYVVHPSMRNRFDGDGMMCRDIDSVALCVRSDRDTPLLTVMRRS